MDDILIKNQPNAARLISSLRNTGYNSYSAIEDIIDNSIDAQASRIEIRMGLINKTPQIQIVDNGMGMDSKTLDEALKLGSITDRDQVSDLGKYGMGLCTASISMSKKLEVLTKKNKDGDLLYSCQDLDEVISKNEFVKSLRKATDTEMLNFHSIVKESGTIITLSNIDRLTNTNLTIFSNYLISDIGRIYRKFIEAGIVFTVNGKQVKKDDPLMLDNPKTKVYSDEMYDLDKSITNQENEKLSVKIVILPKYVEQLEAEKKMNLRTQGFYIMRNNREIANGITLGCFNKHNDYNRMRIEMGFNATLDNEMRVRFSKDGVAPNQYLLDFIKKEIGGQISSIRRLLIKEQRSEDGAKIDHADSENLIAQRAKLLITPESIIEKRSQREDKTNQEHKEPTSSKERNPVTTKTSPRGMGARFETVSLTREGPLYECRQEGKIIVISWNSDHPFYEKMLLENKGKKDITSNLDYLVFSLAAAELKVINDDNVELLSSIKSIMSANLRALL